MNLDILLVPLGISIQIIFLFKREFLVDREKKKWIWGATSILFIVGYFLTRYWGDTIKTLSLLMVPLMAYAIFWLLLLMYRGVFHADPVDTFHSNDFRFMRSGIFNFMYWLLGSAIPVVISYKILS